VKGYKLPVRGSSNANFRRMVSSKATTVEEYLASLPPERRAALAAVRKVIKKNLPRGYEEGMQYGMIGYYVPLTRFPKTYNGQPLGVAALASQKGHMSLYLMSVYGDPETQRWFQSEYKKSGKKLDMGKSCVRFKSPDDLALDVVGKVIARCGVDEFLARYEALRSKPTKKKAARK
jgi:hypothetical protein